MDAREEAIVARLSVRHAVPPDAVRAVLAALRAGGGSMAQFSHPAFGGMSQWAPGMTMVGDMFNNGLKAKLDALCTDLAAFLKEPAATGPAAKADPDVSHRSTHLSSWWPAGLGEPSSTGAQNAMRYAVFPGARRLAIDDNGHITVYDTGEHRIGGVAQSQSTSQTLTFTSQKGLVRAADLPVVPGG